MSTSKIAISLRQQVTQNFKGLCAYCLSQEAISGTQFTVDHIIPESLGGGYGLDNLCLCCWDCNLIKHNRIAGLDPETEIETSLFHPIKEKWQAHFRWVQNGVKIMGKTSTGRATIYLMRLNRPILMQARTRWVEAGWHPPK